MIAAFDKLSTQAKWFLLALVIILTMTLVILNSQFNLFSAWITNADSPLKDITELIINLLSLLFGGGLVRELLLSLRRRQLAYDKSLGIEIIEEPEQVLPKVFNAKNIARRGDRQLQDFELSYRSSRDGSSNTTDTLLAALRRSRYVLIYGPTGTGKTREAAEVAREMAEQNWSVLLYRGDGWLDRPSAWPSDWPQGSNVKVLLFIDDLHKYCMLTYQHPDEVTKEGIVPVLSFQHRLERLIEFMEKSLNPERFRLIATTRKEATYWDALKIKQHSRLWRKFEMYELCPLSKEDLVTLFKECITELNLSLSANDPISYVDNTDGMPLTIVASVISASQKKKMLEPGDMRGTSDLTWADIYQASLRNPKEYPLLPEIYDAVNVLLQANLPLEPDLITMWIYAHLKGPIWNKLFTAYKVKRTLKNLARYHSWWEIRTDGTIHVRSEVLTGKPNLASL